VEQILLTVLKIPPAMDCSVDGSDDMTYICIHGVA
jgi:hypothetical protein